MTQGIFGGMLMTYAIFAVVIMSIRALRTCMCPINACASFPDLSAFSGLNLVLLPGEFTFIQPFRGILMHPGLSLGFLESLSALCVRVYTSDTSV